MSNSNKALFAVIGLIVIVGGLVTFVGSGANSGTIPTPEPTPVVTEAMATATPAVSPTASGAVMQGKADVELTVHGGSFYYKPDTITAKKGDTIQVTYTNDGGFHDFNIDELNVHSAKIKTGETTTVTFVASKAGTFEYYCSVGNHRNMGQKGKITIK